MPVPGVRLANAGKASAENSRLSPSSSVALISTDRLAASATCSGGISARTGASWGSAITHWASVHRSAQARPSSTVMKPFTSSSRGSSAPDAVWLRAAKIASRSSRSISPSASTSHTSPNAGDPRAARLSRMSTRARLAPCCNVRPVLTACSCVARRCYRPEFRPHALQQVRSSSSEESVYPACRAPQSRSGRYHCQVRPDPLRRL